MGFSVTGYVENMRDGTVHLVAEGSRPTVSAVIQGVLERMRSEVRDHVEKWGEATGEFPDFTIRQNRR